MSCPIIQLFYHNLKREHIWRNAYANLFVSNSYNLIYTTRKNRNLSTRQKTPEIKLVMHSSYPPRYNTEKFCYQCIKSTKA